jgi:hypothetical protein
VPYSEGPDTGSIFIFTFAAKLAEKVESFCPETSLLRDSYREIDPPKEEDPNIGPPPLD